MICPVAVEIEYASSARWRRVQAAIEQHRHRIDGEEAEQQQQRQHRQIAAAQQRRRRSVSCGPSSPLAVSRPAVCSDIPVPQPRRLVISTMPLSASTLTQSPVSITCERILIQLRHRRRVRDHGAERDLGRHLVEDHRPRRRAVQPRHVKIGRPAGRALGAGKHQDLVLEALAAQFVPALDHGAVALVDAAPAGDRVAGDDRLALGAAADDLAPAQHDFRLVLAHERLAHRRPPSQRPLTAASTQCLTEPNQADTPVMAGR